MRENRGRRTIRYTFLLTPDEFASAKQVAAFEYRTLPDFLRTQILKAADHMHYDQHRTDGGTSSVRNQSGKEYHSAELQPKKANH